MPLRPGAPAAPHWLPAKNQATPRAARYFLGNLTQPMATGSQFTQRRWWSSLRATLQAVSGTRPGGVDMAVMGVGYSLP